MAGRWTTAAGRLTLNMLGSVAQWERETIRERIADALRHKRDHLEVYGPVPYGFTRAAGGRFVPVERELEVVKLIYALRRKGKTLAAIARVLSKKGTFTRRVKKWAPATLLYILKNDLYQRHLKAAYAAGEDRGPRDVAAHPGTVRRDES